MEIPFMIQGGTIVGADHLGSCETPKGRNNHDSYYWIILSDGTVVAIICDGCGGAPSKSENSFNEYKHSEVGAKIAARLISTVIEKLLLSKSKSKFCDAANCSEFLELVRLESLSKLYEIAKLMTSDNSSVSQTIRDFFLFTVVGVVITNESTVVFSVGDGTFAVNEKLLRIGPFRDNIPPYLMYGLNGTIEYPKDHQLLRFQINELIPTSHINTILIGSDGVGDLLELRDRKIPGQDQIVGPISQFWENPILVNTRFGISRRLALLNGEVQSIKNGKLVIEHRLLKDDTTMIVIQRKEARGL